MSRCCGNAFRKSGPVGQLFASTGGWVVLATVAFSASIGLGQTLSPEVLEHCKRSAMMVLTAHSKNADGDTPIGSGSGFFVNSTGLAISNNHVVDPGHGKPPGEKFRLKGEYNRLVWTIVTAGGTSEEQEWRSDVLYQNEKADIAILQVKDKDGKNLATPHYLKVLPTSEVTVNMKAWCLGFPGGDSRKGTVGEHAEVAVTSGNITGLPKSPSGRLTMIDTDVLANPGNSGGPFVDAQGRLVGALTLGSQSETRTNDTKLVPGDIIREMLQTAFRRSKIPPTVDITPFYDLFVSKDRTWEIPGLPRAEDRDCATLNDGNRLCGSMAQAKVVCPSPLGDLELPASAVAYILSGEQGATAFLDGGDRFLVDRDPAKFELIPTGGQATPVKLRDASFLAFRRQSAAPLPPSGNALVIGGDSYHLSLFELAGDVEFKSDAGAGTIKIPARNVRRIQKIDGKQVVHTVDGTRLTGEFLTHSLTAKLAWSGTPIKFSFVKVENAEISEIDYAEQLKVREIDLAESLRTSDRRVIDIANYLDEGKVKEAKPLLEELLDPQEFRALSQDKKDQIKFLEGELLLRSSEYGPAADVFKKLKKSKIADVSWHARARLSLLEHHQDGTFEGAQISDHAVFQRAAANLANEYARDARHTLDEVENAQITSRGDYLRLLKRADETEELLLIANRLTAGSSDEYIVRLWRGVSNLHRTEGQRLMDERKKVQEDLQGGGGQQRRQTETQRRQLNDKLAQIERDFQKIETDLTDLNQKITDAGFIIDDPDVELGDDTR